MISKYNDGGGSIINDNSLKVGGRKVAQESNISYSFHLTYVLLFFHILILHTIVSKTIEPWEISHGMGDLPGLDLFSGDLP